MDSCRDRHVHRYWMRWSDDRHRNARGHPQGRGAERDDRIRWRLVVRRREHVERRREHVERRREHVERRVQQLRPRRLRRWHRQHRLLSVECRGGPQVRRERPEVLTRRLPRWLHELPLLRWRHVECGRRAIPLPLGCRHGCEGRRCRSLPPNYSSSVLAGHLSVVCSRLGLGVVVVHRVRLPWIGRKCRSLRLLRRIGHLWVRQRQHVLLRRRREAHRVAELVLLRGLRSDVRPARTARIERVHSVASVLDGCRHSPVWQSDLRREPGLRAADVRRRSEPVRPPSGCRHVPSGLDLRSVVSPFHARRLRSSTMHESTALLCRHTPGVPPGGDGVGGALPVRRFRVPVRRLCGDVWPQRHVRCSVRRRR